MRDGESKRTMGFTRDPGPLRLTGFRGSNSEAIRHCLEDAGLTGSLVAADLSLGAWRGHQVARELCSQLSLEVAGGGAPIKHPRPRADMAYADVIGGFIDAEASGDQATLVALATAGRIRDRCDGGAPLVFLVVIPPVGTPWERENIIFVRLLTQALRGTSSHLVLVASSEGQPDVPSDWAVEWRDTGYTATTSTDATSLACLVPGVIEPSLADALRQDTGTGNLPLVPLLNGHWLVSPSGRRPLAEIPRLDFDRLGILARGWPWLDAFAQCSGHLAHVEPWFLFAEAQQRLAEGGVGIALRLLNRALTRASGPDWGIMQSFAQGLTVASHRFAAAAAAADPPAALPAHEKSFLLQCKGWGLVMLGDLARADACFARASDLLPPAAHGSAEHLYLMNISALSHLKAGNAERALEIERDIERRRQALDPPDWRLAFVNAINIARLCRRLGEWDESARYFQEAFATADGARTDSDAIHENLIFAHLYTSAERSIDAFHCWMRAALYWLSCDVPEALGRRVLRQLIGREPEPGCNLPELVSASLCDAIRIAAKAAAVETFGAHQPGPGHDAGTAPIFARAESIRLRRLDTAFECALSTAGCSVLVLHDRLEPPIVGAYTERLRGLLASILAARGPRGFLSSCGTLVVDDRCGRRMATTPEEIVAVCIRRGVDTVAIDGTIIRLPAERRARLEARMRIKVGSAVNWVAIQEERIAVSFKRFLPSIVLSPLESQVLAAIDDRQTVADFRDVFDSTGSVTRETRVDALAVLRRLEDARVIEIDLPGGIGCDGWDSL